MADRRPPIPAPPQDPTPPTPDSDSPKPDLAAPYNGLLSPDQDVFLSPYKENFQFRRPPSPSSSTTDSPRLPSNLPSPNLPLSPYSPMIPFSPVYQTMSGEPMTVAQDGQQPTPFNFQPMAMAKSPITKSVHFPYILPSPTKKRHTDNYPAQQSVGQRRGHKYKHSSVSHQIFLEPPPRAPISLPNSLPIPTLREAWRSMSREQNTRFWWSICHALIAAYTLWSAGSSLALTSLSHLIFYDSLGALLCVFVDVFSNFDVWKRSTIRHPFGLERAEVLAGFAMSVLLVFMGMDLISTNIQHVLEEVGRHEAHHAHSHARVSAGSIDTAALLAMVATVVSALVLHNHARIGRVMRIGVFSSLPSILSNPSHLLTLTCSALLLFLPLLSIEVYTTLDRLLSGTIAVCMCLVGGRLVHKLGLMLLMSFSPSHSHSPSMQFSKISQTSKTPPNSSPIPSLLSTIEADPLVVHVQSAKIWQVHYGLCMASFVLRVRGEESNLVRLRDRVTSLVRNRLGGGYGGGGGAQRWEVSVQLEREKVGLGFSHGMGSNLGGSVGVPGTGGMGMSFGGVLGSGGLGVVAGGTQRGRKDSKVL